MASYRRKGHWRRGRDGRMHWVSEHSVTKGSSQKRRSSTSWSSYSATWISQSRSPVHSQPVPTRYPALPYSARWLKPNAHCPVCGAAVYFWSNAEGSRVYFDEMGPPWPKHPCTDPRPAASTCGLSLSLYKTKATPETVAHAGDFRQRFAVPPARAYELEKVVWNGHASWLHVRRIGWLRWRTVLLVPYPFPRVAPGHLIFVSQGRISLLDPATLQILEFPAATARQAK